jgi:hemolysin activation/secretion protein
MYGTAELRLPVWGKSVNWFSEVTMHSIQVAGFVDYGLVKLNDAYTAELEDADIIGAGLGIRWAMSPYIQAKLDWGKSIGGERPLRKGDDDSGVFYFQFSFFY